MKKKGILITIIVIIVLLILAGGAFAYVYFATDLLKSDKELFAKYAVQMGDKEFGFFPTSLEEYLNKKDTTAYENNGNFSANTTITADISTNSTLQSINSALEKANVSNISFSGRVDSMNKKVEQNIVLNYSDTVNFPFNYKQDGDVYGLQADVISPSYIAFENNNLQEFAQKMGDTDISNVPNKIEFPDISALKFTNEEISHVIEKYFMPTFTSLADDKFTRAENPDGSVTYTLSITNIELRNIEIQMLETLKNDTMILNKINTILQDVYNTYGMSEEAVPQMTNVEGQVNTNATAETESKIELKPENIDNLIANLSEENLKEVMVAISITQNDGITNRVAVTQEGTTITFSKEQAEGNITYDVLIMNSNKEEDTTNTETNIETLELILAYSGLNTNSVTEDISMNINLGGKYNTTYSFVNTVNFGNAVNIEGFGQDTAILNNYNAEQIAPFLTQVILIIAQNNTELMNQIGFSVEMVNPLFVAVCAPTLLNNLLVSNDLVENAEQSNEIVDEVNNKEEQSVSNTEFLINETLNDVENVQ